MRTPPSTILPVLALLVLALTGLTSCGGKAARERSQALLESQSGEQWFCQVAEDQISWDCVQSDQLAAAPAPERMPVSRDELLIAQRTSISSETLEGDETEVTELEVDEFIDVEIEDIETDVVEIDGVETDVVETDLVETGVVETGVVETDSLETEIAMVDTVVPEADSPVPTSVELYALPDDAFVVQLVAMRSARTLDDLINDRELTGVFAVRIAVDGEVYHVLVTGPYDDEPSAQEFAAVPPDQLQDFQLWVRSVRSLKAAMREAEELSVNGADEQS